MFKQLLGLGLVLVSLGAIAVPVRALNEGVEDSVPTPAEYSFAVDALSFLRAMYPDRTFTMTEMYSLVPTANQYCEVRRLGGTRLQFLQAWTEIKPKNDSVEISVLKDAIVAAMVTSAGFNICPDIRN
jgi:hypothetical protein